MNKVDLKLMDDIKRIKQEKSIYIIAHYYQRDEIQDIADFIGDSYAMAIAAKESPCKTILVAGVDFMAQTAAMLCPDKIILSPETRATCPMANSTFVEDILDYKRDHPDAIVISYVNTPAEIKAVSDICCTSSNAEKIIRQLPEKSRIFFIPDRNLGINIARRLGRIFDYYYSSCPIHARVTKKEILQLKQKYLNALVLVHPECDPEVVEIADYVGSTAGILKYTCDSKASRFIIGTECGIMHSIQKACPAKELILASSELICPNMKSITLDKILYSLENLETVITVEESIREKAILALEKMIEYASA
ncbi:MAG: quinolinate synthase NadA [Desulfitobacteriaceae bacterium]|nr:quinolinate synthase NadA [Desulfitobacteriaceae bacterium]MDD4346566.1 quinolinate synthase NadA [Desulfitobacteriaceae bacterium]MDD4401099.1 quinolinate synthase NadA [Desulfitobacteriaceae bacterium]